MTPLILATAAAWLAAGGFVIYYGAVMDTHSHVAQNAWWLGLGLWISASSGLVRRLGYAEISDHVATLAWALIAVVLVWRIATIASLRRRR